jgi:hypothetical protein
MKNINETIGCVNHDCDKCKAVQEPIYQMQMMDGKWIDQAKQSYEYNKAHGHTVRIVYTTPPAAQPRNNAVLLELLSRALPMVVVAYSRGFVDAEAIGRDIEEVLGRAPEKGQP